MAAPAEPPAYSGNDKGGITADRTESLDGIRISMSSGDSKRNTTHRQLKARHIQLIGIGGTIGTVLYVSPLSLSLSVSPHPRIKQTKQQYDYD